MQKKIYKIQIFLEHKWEDLNDKEYLSREADEAIENLSRYMDSPLRKSYLGTRNIQILSIRNHKIHET